MAEKRSAIQFVYRGQVVALESIEPGQTLLNWLRKTRGAVGTKEGCAEGDCGACTVVLRRPSDHDGNWMPVNACILLLGQVDGAEVLTIEDLAVDENLHPVQQALIDHHGSQCGFCTPGIAMNLAAWHANGNKEEYSVQTVLAGNLCRCTGYRAIVNAANCAASVAPCNQFIAARQQADVKIKAIQDERDIMLGNEANFFAAPFNENSLAELLAKHQDAIIVSGATDFGLRITKELMQPPKIVWIGRIDSLKKVESQPDSVRIGAAVSIMRTMKAIGDIDQSIKSVLLRFGSVQIRTSGTIGGNIANGSPVGDLAPILIALESEIDLKLGKATRNMPLEDFFISYKKQDRKAGEYLESFKVPKLKDGEKFRAYKITKRFDEDISSVFLAAKIYVEDDYIKTARIAFGGMAAIPSRAPLVELALKNLSLKDKSRWLHVLHAIKEDFSPISDQRASASYRQQVASNLLYKLLLEMSGSPHDTCIFELRT